MPKNIRNTNRITYRNIVELPVEIPCKLHAEIPSELPAELLAETFRIYSPGIGLCNNVCDDICNAVWDKVCNNGCNTNLQFQKNVKPLPQTPYQASAWSYRYGH